jgi:hypothetical protein
MQEQPANPQLECFRVFGYLALVGGACIFLLFLANVRSRYFYSGPNFLWLGLVAAYAVIVGWGLVRIRRWAVIGFAAPLCLGSFVIGVLAVLNQPTIRTVLLACCFAVLFSIPAALSLRRWDTLRDS